MVKLQLSGALKLFYKEISHMVQVIGVLRRVPVNHVVSSATNRCILGVSAPRFTKACATFSEFSCFP